MAEPTQTVALAGVGVGPEVMAPTSRLPAREPALRVIDRLGHHAFAADALPATEVVSG